MATRVPPDKSANPTEWDSLAVLMRSIHWLNCWTLDWAGVGSSPSKTSPTSPVGTVGSNTSINPPGASNSKHSEAAEIRSSSWRSMTKKLPKKGNTNWYDLELQEGLVKKYILFKLKKYL